MRITSLSIDTQHPRAPLIHVAADTDDGHVKVTLHSDEIHGCLEPTRDAKGQPIEIDGLGRPAHWTGVPRVTEIEQRVLARIAEAKTPQSVELQVAIADKAKRDAVAAMQAEEQAQDRRLLAEAAALDAEARTAAADAEHARLSLEIAQMQAQAETAAVKAP